MESTKVYQGQCLSTMSAMGNVCQCTWSQPRLTNVNVCQQSGPRAMSVNGLGVNREQPKGNNVCQWSWIARKSFSFSAWKPPTCRQITIDKWSNLSKKFVKKEQDRKISIYISSKLLLMVLIF